MRHEWKLASKIHIASAILMVVFSAIGFYFMFSALNYNVVMLEYGGGIHVILGFFSLVSLLVNSYLGLKAFNLRR